MITTLDKNKLYGERTALIDEAAEELRLANITGRQSVSILNLIHDKHDECIAALREDQEVDIDDVVMAYRGLVRSVLNKI